MVAHALQLHRTRVHHVVLYNACHRPPQSHATTYSQRLQPVCSAVPHINGSPHSSQASPADQPNINVVHARSCLEKQLLVPESPRNLWLAAIKPPMYSVAYVPILVGAALAYYQSGVVIAATTLQLCLASTFVIAWLNTSNDGFDATTGVDGQHKPESLVNLTGDRRAVLWIAHVLLALGVGLLATILVPMGDHRAIYMLAAAIACGYVYQGPPFRLSYRGLGEPLCFLAFGPLATTSFFLAQVHAPVVAPIPLVVWATGALVGVTTSVILFCSHFHQIEGDRAAGKWSPLVRLGHQTAAEVLRLVCVATYCAVAALVHWQVLPQQVMATMVLTLPMALSMVWQAHNHHHVPALVRTLKFRAIRWHVAVGAALVAGLLRARFSG